jgi:hypothetical protein
VKLDMKECVKLDMKEEQLEMTEEEMADATAYPNSDPAKLMGPHDEACQEQWVFWAETAEGWDSPRQFESSYALCVFFVQNRSSYQKWDNKRIELEISELELG